MEEENEFFEISAVSRLTGISPHVLRVWERRYAVVEPRRSETKRRMYSATDIQRLALLKTLVDNGHAIGTVANLSTRQLQDRIAAVLGEDCSDDDQSNEADDGERVATVGTKVRRAVREMVESSESAKLVGEFDNLSDLTKGLRSGAADIVIYEKDTIFGDDVEEVRDVFGQLELDRVVYVYHFASEEILKGLKSEGSRTLRAPVDATAIRQACELKAAPARNQSATRPFFDEDGEIPPRAFSDEQLAKVATLNSVIDCECPQHIGHLISGLFAFEQYSEQCENRNEKDAELHAFLHRTTAQCRSHMESALAKILEDEGITL